MTSCSMVEFMVTAVRTSNLTSETYDYKFKVRFESQKGR
jgi:hypothetical protein